MATGIIFGGYLLSEDQFIPIFEEWYNQKKNDFRQALQKEIIDVIEKMIYETTKSNNKGTLKKTTKKVQNQYNAKKIYEAWERLSQNYFGNGTISILAGVKFESEEYQWTKVIDEKEVVGQSGIRIQKNVFKEINENMNDINGLFAAAELQDLINNHYDNLIRALNTYQLTKEDAIALHILLYYRKSKLNRPGFTGSTYGNILFKTQSNAEGKQLDAFMNHMGNYHQELFNLMSIGYIDANSLLNLKTNIGNEGDFNSIFSKNRDEIQIWLLDSLNSTAWFSGGDILVIGETGAVIYNIQLKTTGKGKTFELASQGLLNFARRMIKLIDAETSPKTLAEIMFKQLKISSANEISGTEKFFEEKCYEMVEENLKLEKGSISINIFS